MRISLIHPPSACTFGNEYLVLMVFAFLGEIWRYFDFLNWRSNLVRHFPHWLGQDVFVAIFGGV